MLATHDPLQLAQYSHQICLMTGLPVQIVATIESTNSALLAEAEHLPLSPALPKALIALHQTAGRGRRGRQWLASDTPAPSAFIASLGVRTSHRLADFSVLPLHVGIAVVEQLRRWGCHASLKWPNDIVIPVNKQSAKLGGILVETRSIHSDNAVIIGMGLNWFNAPEMPDRLTACALHYATDAPEPTAIYATLLQAMHLGWQRTIGKTPCDFSNYDALFGKSVTAHNSQSQSIQGIAVGINELGHLGLQTDSELLWLHSGEISVREQS